MIGRFSRFTVAAAVAAPMALASTAQAAVPENALRTVDYLDAAGQAALYGKQASQAVMNMNPSPAVESYARQVVQHSESARRKIQELITSGVVGANTSAAHMKLPEELNEDFTKRIDGLKGDTGVQGVRGYLEDQVALQSWALDLHRNYARFGNNKTLAPVSAEIADATEANLKQARDILARADRAAASGDDASVLIVTETVVPANTTATQRQQATTNRSAATSQAQDRSGQQGRVSLEKYSQVLFNRMDADNNGTVTVSEWDNHYDRRYGEKPVDLEASKWDTDGDDTISMSEMKRALNINPQLSQR